jgi:hypothetical protein
VGVKFEFTGATFAIAAAGALAWAAQKSGQRKRGSAARVVPFDKDREPLPQEQRRRRAPRPPRVKPPMRAWQIGPMRPDEAEQISAHIREQARLDPDSWHHEVKTPSRGGRSIVLFVARRPYPGATPMDSPPIRGSRAPGDEDEPGPSGQQLRERQRIERAPARSQLSFADWVDQTEQLRGAPLVEGDPWQPVVDASEAMTWYDLWLTGVPPAEAAGR